MFKKVLFVILIICVNAAPIHPTISINGKPLPPTIFGIYNANYTSTFGPGPQQLANPTSPINGKPLPPAIFGIYDANYTSTFGPGPQQLKLATMYLYMFKHVILFCTTTVIFVLSITLVFRSIYEIEM